jgi:exopolysaccharide biosynthesis polyprenyl glycosylphosphotransferase
MSMALIVGANAEGRSLAEQLQRWKTSGLYVVGLVGNPPEMTSPASPVPRYLGALERIDDIIAQYGVEELIIAPSDLTRDKILNIFNRYGVSSNVNLRLSSGLYEIITTGLQVSEVADVPLVKVNKVRLTGFDQVMKQVIDFTVAFFCLLVAFPVMLVLALLIKLDSPGPVIHRRRVLGVNGRQFDAYKFRTMVVNGDELLSRHPKLQEELSHSHKLKDDPRVTRLGKFMRKYSLDELPQLFNVIKRDMSVVGPRMITSEEMKHYNHWAINLLTVRPGITGLWQVSGRSDTSYEHRVRLDMQYIRNWSFWLELQIIYRTIPVVLKGKGAY